MDENHIFVLSFFFILLRLPNRRLCASWHHHLVLTSHTHLSLPGTRSHPSVKASPPVVVPIRIRIVIFYSVDGGCVLCGWSCEGTPLFLLPYTMIVVVVDMWFVLWGWTTWIATTTQQHCHSSSSSYHVQAMDHNNLHHSPPRPPRSSTSSSSSSSNHQRHRRVHVPITLALKDLQQGHRMDDLKKAMTTTGLLAVQIPSTLSPLTSHKHVALNGLCQCQEALRLVATSSSSSSSSSLSPKMVDHVPLRDDRHTVRTTVATSTVGHTPLPLFNELSDICGSNVVHAMEELRDQVALATNAFVQALDQLLVIEQHKQEEERNGHKKTATTTTTTTPPLLRNVYNVEYPTIASIQASAVHLEHFHVYSKSQQQHNDNHPDHTNHTTTTTTTTSTTTTPTTTTTALDYHMDAGLFLSFVPAHNCHHDNQQEEEDLAFVLPNGVPVAVQQKYPRSSSLSDDDDDSSSYNTIMIMLGVGAEYWLQQQQPKQQQPNSNIHRIGLKATRHAVQMYPGQVRSWYGMSKYLYLYRYIYIYVCVSVLDFVCLVF